ncbi:MAG: InlB B-repeat-containing protein, partial [Alphaproteobacteria bacterium]
NYSSAFRGALFGSGKSECAVNVYNADAGQYLAKNGTELSTCPANSFCPGGTFEFSETANQGINSCPTGFGLSAAGAGAQTDCYRTCTTNDVEHSMSVSGGFYYGNNNQCSAETCVTGYHKADGVISYLLSDVAYILGNEQVVQQVFPGKTTITAQELTPEIIAVSLAGYGSVSEYQQNGNDIEVFIKDLSAISKGRVWLESKGISGDNIFENEVGWKTREGYYGNGGGNYSYQYNWIDGDTWTAVFSWGDITGTSICDDAYGTKTEIKPGNTLFDDDSGEYCWCKMTGYTPIGGELQNLSESSSWVSCTDMRSYGDYGSCSGACPQFCAMAVNGLNNFSEWATAAFRGALFGGADTNILASCSANTINVTWNPLNGLEPTINQCTYDGAITLPTAPEKTGYTFKGWKLVTGSSN